METGRMLAEITAAVALTAGTGKAVWNTIKTVGPYAVAQWDQASIAQVKHNARLAMVEVGKDFLKQELTNYAEVSKELLSEYGQATPRKKLQIQKDLEYFDQRVRQINIGILAIGYAQTNADDTEKPQSTPHEVISPHWMDKFNELARVRNEDWRENLLARALAAESASPGSVSPRALWFLGTLEEPIFRAFSTILNLCTTFGSYLLIPNHEAFNQLPIPSNSPGQKVTIGEILFLLDETGVLGDASNSEYQHEEGSIVISYGSEYYLIESHENNLAVRGIMLSSLGKTVALFCESKFNPMGKEILDAWLISIDKNKHTIAPVETERYNKIGPPISS